ncbi:MAG TPA: NAD(P)(+) transhydrogenase (Re/Si-specific) subunit beta, partial [Polyangia bacterium]|nr:NAD(P)(+) transhydrogenase (Re/Si-specific) subunit beta [Polyangia bacterium]
MPALQSLADTWRSLAYLGASLLFILSLRGLSTQESARRGNAFGIAGMGIAVVMTALALLLSTFGAHAADDGAGLSGV